MTLIIVVVTTGGWLQGYSQRNGKLRLHILTEIKVTDRK